MVVSGEIDIATAPVLDAIVQELIPYLEKKYRGLGQGWSRFLYGGSTGGCRGSPRLKRCVLAGALNSPA